MKKLTSCAILIFTFCNSFAQEIETTIVVDSAQVKIESSKATIDEKKSELKSDIYNQNIISREQRKKEDKANDEQRELAKAQKKLKKEQKQAQKENRVIANNNDKLNDAKKREIKLNQRLINANKDLVKLQEKYEKKKAAGNLSAVESSKFEVKITKKQLDVRKIEEDISNLIKE
ncbi:hypothetical protein QWY90_08855 [Flavobacterium paronense]|uniref:Uncharacterized protein n=1 Tax=Flavobacterium paronense TaxID=1392775 RepID=A0ABV5GAD8_9FLAO|nr:hypothetical protein [Flavobacterium paronense]MDN3677426.1 hypothetical protein [Flavobacterium paronense]